MVKHKAYKFRLYPDKEQKILINKTIGSSRFVFNYFLNLWNEEYKKTGKGLSYNKCAVIIPTLKKSDEYSWLKEVDSIALQSSIKNLEDSFNRFFKKQNKAPRFKSKKSPIQSYITKNVGNGIQIQGNRIKLPKLKMVMFANSREINGRILRATISRKASGKYFISLLVEEHVQELEKTNSSVGIDLGIKDFAILDDGTIYNNNRYTTKMAKQLAREQRKLSRRYEQAKKIGEKLEDAKNYQKQKIKVARLHEKVANQREDFLNKVSTIIIKNHDVICIEDLNTKGMLKNHKLARSISDVSWSMFVTKLQYKADWYGKKIVKIDRWYPSSQICSNCGINSGKKTLDIRYWECECGAKHDRDINASINIKNEGLRQVV
ncbi:IS200/IS605 family element RNA-guided endonuclease TnpB [Staphylococcus equorum]|uniref:IS200/IS605 family element RNA-guided endonuclease TnpB n=1 Tax=Staphylococcus equorum TaxID=246432 RepID=UPI002407B821|nr:IS200/IS605 family element RNA-guided endonuclease TnpB [Staphylococcus equorum]MDG0826353.1 IS200/IS605 family element RNA-guided endonuclease TnpB [Staphylococcus equorum]